MINAFIYKGPFDSTNSGISSKVSMISVWDSDHEEANDLTNHYDGVTILKLCRKGLAGGRGGIHLRLEPITSPNRGKWMFGGNFAWSSDSRFPGSYPIPIHDRQELKMFRKLIAWLKSLFSLNTLPAYPALPEKPFVSEKKLGATLKYPSTWEYVWEDGRVYRTESCAFVENNKWTMRDGTPPSKEEARRMNQAIEDWRAEYKRESARKIWDNE